MAISLYALGIGGLSETDEADETGRETDESARSWRETAMLEDLHGAENPRLFHSRFPGEYIEPIGGVRQIERFRDPQDTVDAINPRFDHGLEYQVNCADCARSVEATWRGWQQQAAGRRWLEGESGERMEQWSGDRLEPVSADGLKHMMAEAGHGASAIVCTTQGGEHPMGHAYNVVNYHGRILTVDGQTHEVFDYDEATIRPGFDPALPLVHQAMAWDANGNVIHGRLDSTGE